MRLQVYQIQDDGTQKPAGTVDVEDGELDLMSDDPKLRELIDRLWVSAGFHGPAVPPADPKYHLAVADSIGRQSAWRYVAKVKP